MSIPRRVLITGSRGVLGRRVVEAIKHYHPTIEIVESQVDLTVRKEVERFLGSLPELDVVFHLAALVPIREVNKDPTKAFSVNLGGTLNLLCGLQGRSSKVVFASSSHVYGAKKGPLSENDPLKPNSLYGETKLIAENLIKSMGNSSSWDYLIARIFSMHDSNQTGPFLRPNIEQRFIEDDLTAPFYLEGGGSTRDFMSARKVAELLVRLACKNAEGTVNIASGKPTTVASFAQSLAPSVLNIVSMGDTNDLYADISRLEQFLGV